MKTYEEDRSTRLLVEETKKYKILGREVEQSLFEEYHRSVDLRRKQDIKTLIIQSNLRFVLALAKSYKKQTGLPINDFFSEGKLGMLEAFEKYDYKVGIKFGSFAAYEVRRHMDFIVNTSDIVRVPVVKRHNILNARKKRKPLEHIKYGLLADNALREATSIYAPLCKDGSGHESHMTVSDTISSETQTDANHAEQYLKDVLSDIMEDNLNAEENNLLRRMYGLDGYEDSINEISSERHVSKEYVRRVRSKALAKLRGLREVTELRASCGT